MSVATRRQVVLIGVVVRFRARVDRVRVRILPLHFLFPRYGSKESMTGWRRSERRRRGDGDAKMLAQNIRQSGYIRSTTRWDIA